MSASPLPRSSVASAASAIPAPPGRGEWLAWLAAMSFASVLLGVLYIFAHPTAWWGDYMSWFIAAVFAWTLMRSYRAVRFLDRETRLASEQVALLASLNDVDRFLREARSSAFRSHISSLHNI